MRPPIVPDIQQQLQQQQLLMSLNQCYQQMAMQQMEIQTMQRQLQSLLFAYSEVQDANDSGLSSDLRVRSFPSLFSPMVPRPSPQNDGFLLNQSLSQREQSQRTRPSQTDSFQFNPVLPSREQGQRPSDRLLRSAIGEDSVFESDSQYQRPDSAGDTRYSRMSKIDSYVKKKKTSSPGISGGGQRVRSTSAQARIDSAERASQTRQSGPVPPLQFEQFLARKKR